MRRKKKKYELKRKLRPVDSQQEEPKIKSEIRKKKKIKNREK